MNNPDNISESQETIFMVKLVKFFDADPGSGMEKFGSWILDKHPGSTTLGGGGVPLTLLDVDSEGADLVQVERGIAPAALRAQVGRCRTVLFR
jgi:hypothetical protein